MSRKMNRPSFLSKISSDGYKLLTISTNHALYSDDHGNITLAFGGAALKMTRAELDAAAADRAIVSNGTPDYVTCIKDTILDSLVPITYASDADVRANALRFFAAFSPTAKWEVTAPSDAADVLSEINAIDSVLAGPTRTLHPAFIFLRQRYPNIRFDISMDQPQYSLRALSTAPGPFLLTTPWSAYLKPGAGLTSNNPLVASGYIVHTIDFDTIKGYALINSRKFIVDRITDPVNFKPFILPLLLPQGPLSPGLEYDAKSLVRETTTLRTSLLTISAFLASLNPMLSLTITPSNRDGDISKIVQLAVSSVATLAAIVAMITLALTKIVQAIDEAEAGIQTIAKGVELADDAVGMGQGLGSGGKYDESKVSEREILDGSLFVTEDQEAESLLREDLSGIGPALGGVWKKIAREPPHRAASIDIPVAGSMAAAIGTTPRAGNGFVPTSAAAPAPRAGGVPAIATVNAATVGGSNV